MDGALELWPGEFVVLLVSMAVELLVVMLLLELLVPFVLDLCVVVI